MRLCFDGLLKFPLYNDGASDPHQEYASAHYLYDSITNANIWSWQTLSNSLWLHHHHHRSQNPIPFGRVIPGGLGPLTLAALSQQRLLTGPCCALSWMGLGHGSMRCNKSLLERTP